MYPDSLKIAAQPWWCILALNCDLANNSITVNGQNITTSNRAFEEKVKAGTYDFTVKGRGYMTFDKTSQWVSTKPKLRISPRMQNVQSGTCCFFLEESKTLRYCWNHGNRGYCCDWNQFPQEKICVSISQCERRQS